MSNTKIINLDELEHFVDTAPGSVSLVGENGGASAIVGEIGQSNSIPELFRIETEHGALYLDPEFDVEIQY